MAIIKVITPSVTDANITTAKVTDNAITLAKMASGTDGNIISYDASGNPVAIATGSDGQVLTSTGAGSPPAFETPAGGGKVLQVVQGTHNSEATFSNTSYQATETDVNITPSATSSKIFVTVSLPFLVQTADGQFIPTLYRDSTNLALTAAKGFGFLRCQSSGYYAGIATFSFLDSPSSTSQLHYEAYVKRAGGSGNLFLNYDTGSTSTITAIEIGA